MKSVIGIDPGLSGGIVLIIDGKIKEKYVIPTIEEKRNKKIKNEIDVKTLDSIIKSLKIYNPICFLEKVGAMPGQGVSSMFAFGKGFGIIIGILTANDIEINFVPPQKWTASIHKSYSHMSLESKEKSKLAIKKLFPEENFLVTSRSKVPHAGLMDASLIALYGYQSSIQLKL